ncbi:hypothetical protein [Caballeronia mineralivorans]|jgi:hypothetical protein|uniref:hypothetical protein n=1 Tax=Caballeronia mineralivorans TaxID=2010198 RepID=UPI0023F27CD5|nr:hypothetical protein [Caballeronia mineralivorans]MDB5788226.1 hypothetical protein [Caballeronia mineralivorans]
MDEVNHLVAEMRVDVEEMRADMRRAFSDLKTHLVWCMLACSVAQVALIVGLLRALR